MHVRSRVLRPAAVWGPLWLFMALAAAAHLALALPFPLLWRSGAAWLLTNFIPGALLVEALVGGRPEAAPDPWERFLYSMGAGAALTVLVMLALSYLPGSIPAWLTLVAFDLLIAALGAAIILRAPPADHPVDWMPVWRDAPRNWFSVALVVLLLTAGLLRLTGLGYSEFQGDETRVLLRTAGALQGYEDALLTHHKGPGEILLPAAIYALTDRITETTARLPFTLLNLTGILAVFLLGWRLFGGVAGWCAAMILALDGYFIGFGRIVQYQSMVFCLGTLTVLVLHRLTRLPRRLPQYLTLAAILLSGALLAHYEAGLVALPAAYLLWRLWRQGIGVMRLARALVAPTLVGATVLAAFYLPFMLHPAFAVTYDYITVSRIGGEFPYNNLTDFFARTTLYSTTYYLLLMIAAAVTGLVLVYWRNLPRWAAWTASALLVGGVALTLARPAWLVIAGHDHTWAFFAAALLFAWLQPHFRPEARAIWLWFGAGMLLMLFFTHTPNTHVYGFILPWALLAGSVAGAGYGALAAQIGDRWAQRAGVGAAAFFTVVFGVYAFWYFAAVHVEALRTWRENRLPGYWVPYTMPTPHSIFGFPLQNGWKVVGVLYADGVLDAPFDLHGKEPVADWYTRGQGYCPRDHRYFIWHESVEPAQRDENWAVRADLAAQGYRLFGEALVNGQPRLAIYTLDEPPPIPWRFPVEEYVARFDRDLSGPIFETNGPVGKPQPATAVDFRFGEHIRLVGYTLRGQDNVPGGTVALTLYWQATAPVPFPYRVTTQVIDRSDAYKAGQQDGEPGCNLFPTSTWQPGDVIVDRYTIRLADDARPGTYTLLIGLYDPDGDVGRPGVFTADGMSLGDALGLDEVRIREP